MLPCTSCWRLFEYSRMNTPAIRNQYGEMYTGIPNGRAMTSPGCGSRCCGAGRSGVIPATLTMLRDIGSARGRRGRRAAGVSRPGAVPADGPAQILAVVGGLPYAPFRERPADHAGRPVTP